MNIPAMPAAPERDTAPAGRKTDRNAFAGAFDSALRSVAKEPAADIDAEPTRTDEETGEKTDVEKAADAASSAARDVLGYLAGARRGEAAQAEAQARGTGRDAVAKLDLSAIGSTGARSEPMPSDGAALEIASVERDGKAAKAAEGREARAAARLEILHMETHFEPTSHEAVLVEGAAKGDAERAGRAGALDLRAVLTALTGVGREDGRTTAPSPARADDNGAAEGRAPASAVSAVELSEAVREEARDGDRSRGGERSAMPLAERAASNASVAISAATTTANPAALPVTMQVAERIIDVFAPATTGESPSEAPNSDAHLRLRAGGAALKTLTLQLQPETLGTLDVSMRLVDGELRVELAASRADAARLLGEDKASLQMLLEKAGFSLDEGAITVVARDTAPSARGAETGGERGGNGERAMAGDGGPRRDGDGQGRSYPQNDSPRPVNPSGGSVESASPVRAKGAAVYL